MDMDKLNTHNPIYCMKDNGEKWLNLRGTLDRIYMESIFNIQYFQICLHNDTNEVV